MSSNSSWAPNEDPRTLFSERCWLQGVIISAIAYGITLPLFFFSLLLLAREKGRSGLRKRLPLVIYIVVTFVLGTLYMILIAAWTQMVFIDDRNYPGGPNAFEMEMFSIPLDQAANAAYVLMNWFSDALVVWRFKVIYQSCRVPIRIVMLFPCLLLAGSVAMGIMCLIQDSATNPFVANTVNFTLPYSTLSLALNVILTLAIVLRLMYFRYNIVSVMGSQYGTQYTSVASILIESAAMFSAVAITFLVLFGIGNAVSEVFLQALNQFQVLATLLIVFRVARGKGWNEYTVAYMKTTPSRTLEASDPELPGMVFASPSVSFTLASSGEAGQNIGRDVQDSSPVSGYFVELGRAM